MLPMRFDFFPLKKLKCQENIIKLSLNILYSVRVSCDLSYCTQAANLWYESSKVIDISAPFGIRSP